jgi:hypothetical protein
VPEEVSYVESEAVRGLARPSYWLVWGLEWPGDCDAAEAVAATAPDMIPRDALGADAYEVLGCADLYACKHGHRVVFFSDLTAMFAGASTSWSEIGVDWVNALLELCNSLFPLMFLTISKRAYSVICNPSRSTTAAVSAERTPVADERELARQVVARQLAADWPPYVRSLVEARSVKRRV